MEEQRETGPVGAKGWACGAALQPLRQSRLTLGPRRWRASLCPLPHPGLPPPPLRAATEGLVWSAACGKIHSSAAFPSLGPSRLHQAWRGLEGVNRLFNLCFAALPILALTSLTPVTIVCCCWGGGRGL